MSAPHAPSQPLIQVFYRYTATANNKARPAYFSKSLALQSFVNAVRAAGEQIAVNFLVDGELADDTRALMDSVGTVTLGSWNSNRSSYLAQIERARATGAQLSWFAEDDYLYAPDALARLAEAVRRWPEVDWFALTGPTRLERLELRRAQGPVALPPSPRWPARQGAGRGWRRIDSTTSTFGGRPRAIRQTSWLLRLCPWSGAAWDRTTCLAVQGATPYPWRHVLHDLLPASTPKRLLGVRLLWRVATRLAVNLAALTQRRRPAVLVAPEVPLVGHMELPYEERPEVWDSLAAELLQEDCQQSA